MGVEDFGVEVSATVHLDRDATGRFLSELDRARIESALELSEEGAMLAREFAPGHFKESIKANPGSDEASWYSDDPKAMVVEERTRPHVIVGNPDLQFMGTNKYAGKRIKVHMVRHPGTPGFHFLRKSYDLVRERIMDTLGRHYGRA